MVKTRGLRPAGGLRTSAPGRWLPRLGLAALVAALFVADIALGSILLSPGEIWRALVSSADGGALATAVLSYRLPKAATAALAGAALAVSGLLMQTIFRNPLAGPYILGVSSGASLGVALAMIGGGALGLSAGGALGEATTVTAALVGSGAVLLALLAVSARVRDIMTVLILGMLFGSAISAVIGVLQYFSPESTLKSYVVWSMGSLGAVDGRQLVWLAAAVASGLALAAALAGRLDLALLGESYARTSGMDVRRFRVAAFAATSLMTGSVTAFCGPIGFVGIVVPHIARMAARTTSHRRLIALSAALGAALMLAADIVAQTPGRAGVLPINSVTALFGIPVVVWIMLRGKSAGDLF